MAIDKNAVIKEAQKFTAKGQFDRAIAEWKKLIKVSPNDANIYNTIGDLCLKKDAKPDAVEAYKKAADLLAADGFTSKAIALYKKILNIDPKKVEVHLALGDLNADKGLTGNALESYKLAADHYLKTHDMASALRIYQKMADLNPSNIAFRLKLAEMYVKEGLKTDAAETYIEAADIHVSNNAFQEARQLFEKVLSLDPTNKQVYYKAGIVYFKEGKFAEACKAFKPALEADPENQELLDIYLDALAKSGKTGEAEEMFLKLLSGEPGRLDLREKLYNLYLSIKDYDKAQKEVFSLVDVRIENREFDAAEEILKGYLTENTEGVAARRKLSELYVMLRRNEDAAKELLQAAETLSSKADRDGAREVLVRATELSPGLIEARRMLEALSAQPAPVAEEAPLEMPHPVMPEEAPPAPPLEEEEPGVAEALTEADVLIKYGLSAKALEQLENISAKYPSSPQVRIKLRDLYRDQGNTKKAVEHALRLADIYAKNGLDEQAGSELQAVIELDPDNAEIRSRLGMEPATAPEFGASPPNMEDISLPPEAPRSIEWDMPAAELEMPPLPIPPVIEEREAHAPGHEAAVQEPPAGAVDVSEIWAEAEFYYQQGLFDEARKYYERLIEHSPNDNRVIARLSEISREKEDMQEFTKLTEAVEGLESLVHEEAAAEETAPSTSDDEAVRSLMREIEELKQKQKEEAAETLVKEISRGGTEEKAGVDAREGRAGAEARREEDFFDLGAELREDGGAALFKEKGEKPDDFFDLAAELREELGSVTLTERQTGTSEEQTLDDIFEEFKKGVEEQASKQDLDTHYNLGIAYKEMGLLDDAIGEFMTTPEGEPKFIESRYMLGLCFMEKGEFHNAIVEVQNALNFSESLGGDPAEQISMHYDLGLAYQGAGSINEAIGEFQKVYQAEPGYRDVAVKVKELSQGEFVSLEQLKEDIEKEISAKFLEEGERIEREEKTRRSEKVKN